MPLDPSAPTTLHIQTPLLLHRRLAAALGKPVWLKMENAQPSGSFKLRGIGLLCQRAVAAGATHLVCPSGGNAGFAAAVAGVALGVQTTVVVPVTTGEAVRRAIADIGAALIVHGAAWDDANGEALRLCSAPGTVYIPPFDHPDIWDGNATVIDEALQQALLSVPGDMPFDVVICSVGGGGLLCGVLEGLHRNGLAHVPVIAVETEGAASYAAALAAGEPVTLAAITSVATSLGARRVAQAAFDWHRRHDIISVVVSDAAAVDACIRFADDLRVLVEPACGAALAVAYGDMPPLRRFSRPLVIVCGGIGCDLATLAALQKKFALPSSIQSPP
ncbi:MAG: pyridoxal-phosphate dependent enzyme [Herminiimonas sp.]|nr:pyridoxal-phosphate dependent enzyme [Herminiimonas sp.]